MPDPARRTIGRAFEDLPLARARPSMKTAYVVLGMHRSGTSSVAGALTLLGAAAPRTLMQAAADNPTGFWESEKITEFNDEVLHAAGSSWLDWGALDPAVFSGEHAEHFHSASRWLIRTEFRGAETIVLKDPRICRAYPFWREALLDSGYAPMVVSPLRPPIEVAESLFARNGTPRSLGMRLWLKHVLDAELATRDQPRHLMLWTDFLSDWRGQFEMMANRLCVPPLPVDDRGAAVDAFLDRDLHRQKARLASEPAYALVERAYAALSAVAIDGESTSSRKALDSVRSEFAQLMKLFYDSPCRL